MMAADPLPQSAGHAGSAPIRIVQVSDTHVSRKRAYFVDNWHVFVDEMSRQPPDLIVHSGDVSFDGAGDEDDIAFARREKDRLRAPWMAIPGNHDIGELPLAIRLQQPVNAERMARWRRHYGASRWCRDIGAWRLIGIDTALLGSGEEEEHEQALFLERSLAERAGRPIMLFQHLPPFENDPDDPAFTAAAVPAAPRKWLLDTCVAKRRGGDCLRPSARLPAHASIAASRSSGRPPPRSSILSRGSTEVSECRAPATSSGRSKDRSIESSAGRAAADDHA